MVDCGRADASADGAVWRLLDGVCGRGTPGEVANGKAVTALLMLPLGCGGHPSAAWREATLDAQVLFPLEVDMVRMAGAGGPGVAGVVVRAHCPAAADGNAGTAGDAAGCILRSSSLR